MKGGRGNHRVQEYLRLIILRRKEMGTENSDQHQNETPQPRNGVAIDDKSKGATFSEGNAGGLGGSTSTGEPVSTSQSVAEPRGGLAIDDRAKDFELFDDPKA